MQKYDANQVLKAQNSEKEPRANAYEKLPKEQRAPLFYGTNTPDEEGNVLVAEGGRRDTRDYIESVGRLLPVTKGGAPMTRAVMSKMFRGKSGKQRREERAAKAEAARKERHLAAQVERDQAAASA